MEIGAVKQAFNNELILLKKKLNQAKTQIIHKLTRKAKQLTEKKAPDAIKEKFKKKAENAVKEVLILKKIKARDIGRFIVTHTGKLEDYLNKPQVDNDKACARILLHKAMKEKYNFIRNRFSNIPIKDLFMSRNERLKLKKEEKLKKKEKRDRKKAKNNLVNAEGDWDVEDVIEKRSKAAISQSDDNDDAKSDDDQDMSDKDKVNSEQSESDEQEMSGEDQEEQSEESDEGSDNEGFIEDGSGKGFKISFKGQSDESEDEDSHNEMEASEDQESSEEDADSGKLDKIAPTKNKINAVTLNAKESPVKKKTNDKIVKSIEKTSKSSTKEAIKSPIKLEKIKKKAKQDKKQKDNKNKNLQDKIAHKKFKKDSDDTHEVEHKVVDPFFVTVSGENYMSIVEPRQPDEVKEEHKQGNRKLRRAVMFGHVPKIKPRQEFKQDNNKFDRQNGFNKRPGNKYEQQNFSRNNNKYNNNDDNNRYNKTSRFEDTNSRFNDRSDRKTQEDSKPEKLHPSWEAKKKQSGILPFKGKKIVFDDN